MEVNEDYDYVDGDGHLDSGCAHIQGLKMPSITRTPIMTETIINTNMIVMSGKEEEILMTMTIGIVGNRREQNRTGRLL